MSLPYKKPSEFIDRYHNSVIYYDNNPVWIAGVTPKSDRNIEEQTTDADWKDRVYLYFQHLPWVSSGENKQHKYLATDEKFSAVPINLGYANVSFRTDDITGRKIRYATYLTRMPVRRNKQGLGQENIHIPTGQSFLDLLYDSEFVNMLRNRYRSFSEVQAEISKNRDTLGVTAFDQKLALEFDTLDQFILHYKGQKVGYSQDGDTFTLSKSTLWLRETLEGKGLKVR